MWVLVIDLKIILLDEFVVGMNYFEIYYLMDIIVKICKDFNLIVLFIEYDMKFVMGICENIVVFDYG